MPNLAKEGFRTNRNKIPWVLVFDIALTFRSLWEDTVKTEFNPWECPHGTFLLCFTCLARTSAQRICFLVSNCISCVCVFSHMEKFQDNRVDSLWAPACDASLVFNTLRGDISTTTSIPWQCPRLTIFLRFTCFGRISGQQN